MSGFQIEKRFLMKSTQKTGLLRNERKYFFFFFFIGHVGHKYTQSCYSSNECASNMQHWPVGFYYYFYFCNKILLQYS